MAKRFIFLFLVLALALASAKTYSVTLFQPSVVAGTELQPGDYKLELQANKIVLKSGKQVVESPVKVEENSSKFPTTTVRYADSGGKYQVREIRLGGTKLKLVLD